VNLIERCVCGTVWEASFLSTKNIAEPEDLTPDLIAAMADRAEWREDHAAHIARWMDERVDRLKAKIEPPPTVEAGGA
jgi:hypothetical protein